MAYTCWNFEWPINCNNLVWYSPNIMPYASTCAEAGATTFWKKKKVEKHVENNMRIVRTNYLFSHMISYQLKGLKNEIVIGDTNIVQCRHCALESDQFSWDDGVRDFRTCPAGNRNQQGHALVEMRSLKACIGAVLQLKRRAAWQIYAVNRSADCNLQLRCGDPQHFTPF
jgi:hypothetical protein